MDGTCAMVLPRSILERASSLAPVLRGNHWSLRSRYRMAKVVGANVDIVCSKHPEGRLIRLDTLSGVRRF